MKPTARLLSLFDIFREISEQQRESIAAKMRCRQYFAGNYIISASTSGHVYFLVKGTVRACAYTDAGKQVYFEDLGAGSVFGELSVIDNGPRTSDCVCITACEIASLDRNTFLDLLNENFSVNHAVLKRLAAIVRDQMQRVYEYSSYSVNQRIRFELLRLASENGEERDPVVLAKVPTQLELANRISSHREAISKELKILEREKLIIWSRKSHVILDKAGLLERALHG